MSSGEAALIVTWIPSGQALSAVAATWISSAATAGRGKVHRNAIQARAMPMRSSIRPNDPSASQQAGALEPVDQARFLGMALTERRQPGLETGRAGRAPVD